MGEFDLYHSEVTTLAWDPVFVPEVGLKGLTWNSISIGWNSPPENFAPYIHYYKLTKKTDDQEVTFCNDIFPVVNNFTLSSLIRDKPTLYIVMLKPFLFSLI